MKIIDAGKVRIVVASATVGVNRFVDVRAFKPTFQGQLSPTSSGLLVPEERIEAVVAALQAELAAIRAQQQNLLYYFLEGVDDRRAQRRVAQAKVSHTFKHAREKSPQEYGAESNFGYLFKCCHYTSDCTSYIFKPTRPIAVWDSKKSKWVKFEPR